MISLGRIDPVRAVDFRCLPDFIRVVVNDGYEFGYCREHAKLMLDVQDPVIASPYARIAVREAVERGLVPRFTIDQLNHHNHRVVKVFEPKEPFCRICQIDEVIGSPRPDPDWVPLCGCPCR